MIYFGHEHIMPNWKFVTWILMYCWKGYDVIISFEFTIKSMIFMLINVLYFVENFD